MEMLISSAGRACCVIRQQVLSADKVVQTCRARQGGEPLLRCWLPSRAGFRDLPSPAFAHLQPTSFPQVAASDQLDTVPMSVDQPRRPFRRQERPAPETKRRCDRFRVGQIISARLVGALEFELSKWRNALASGHHDFGYRGGAGCSVRIHGEKLTLFSVSSLRSK